MLILPLHKPLNLQTLPWLSLVLILINTVVFFFMQVPAQRYQMRAMEHYVASDLLDIEWPVYLAMAKPAEERKQLEELAEASQSEDIPEPVLRQLRMEMLQNSPGFEALRAQQSVLPTGDPRRDSYLESRRYVDSLWDRGNFTERYALKFGTFEPHRLLSACFLHGDFSHLFGNMVMLFVVALVLERAFSGGRFVLLYLLAGIGASVASSYAHRYQFGYGLGASGAIAGLMGALPVVWGLRKIRVFYWIAFYFNYARVPALVLLPLWLGYELLQAQISDSNVDFQAHAGGMVTGALLAWLLVRMAAPKEEFFEDASPRIAEQSIGAHGHSGPGNQRERQQLQALQAQQLQAGMDALGRADFSEASQLLSKVAAQRSSDFELQMQAYRAAKFAGDTTKLLDNAKRALQLPVSEPESLERQLGLWRELRPKGVDAQLPAPLLIALALRWQRTSWNEAWEALVRLSQASDRAVITPTQWRELFSSMLEHCRQPNQRLQLEKMLARIAQHTGNSG